jgi:membrane protease YdiL (CAAX protease family)
LSSFDNPHFEPQPPGDSESQVSVSGVSADFDPAAGAPSIAAHPGVPVPRDPVWSGWDVLLIAVLTIVTLVAVETVTAKVAQIFFYRQSSFGDVVQKPILVLLGEFLAYIAVAIYMVMLVEGKYHERFSRAIRWNWPSSNGELLFLGMLGMFTVLLDLLSRYLPMPKSTPFDQFFSRPRDAYLIAIFAVTIGPLMEELFFRGFLYPAVARRTGVPLAILLTALPFGLMHYLQYRSWAAVLVITLVGVVLTVVRAATKSVAASFVVHVGYNATLMLLAAVATDGFRHMDRAGIACFPLQ